MDVEGKYEWLPRAIDFAETWGLDVEMVEAVAEYPERVEADPNSATAGYPIRRHRRGDVEVCVGFRFPDHPAIIFVRMHLPMDNSKGGTNHSPVKKAAAKAPNGLRQFKQWVYDAGYQVELRNGHLHILRPNGTRLMGTGSTPGDKMAVTAAWQKFLRESAKDQQTPPGAHEED